MIIKFIEELQGVVETYFIVNPTEDDKIMMTPKLIDEYFNDGDKKDGYSFNGISLDYLDYNESGKYLIIMLTTKLDYTKLIEIAAQAAHKRFYSLINPNNDQSPATLDKFKVSNFDISLQWVAKDSAMIYEAMNKAIETMLQRELESKKTSPKKKILEN